MSTKVNASEFVKLFAKELEITQELAKLYCKAYEELFHRLVQENDIVNTGLFQAKHATRSARVGRNPRTGEPIQIPAKEVVVVKLV